jgi:hypothetical protein
LLTLVDTSDTEDKAGGPKPLLISSSPALPKEWGESATDENRGIKRSRMFAPSDVRVAGPSRSVKTATPKRRAPAMPTLTSTSGTASYAPPSFLRTTTVAPGLGPPLTGPPKLTDPNRTAASEKPATPAGSPSGPPSPPPQTTPTPSVGQVARRVVKTSKTNFPADGRLYSKEDVDKWTQGQCRRYYLELIDRGYTGYPASALPSSTKNTKKKGGSRAFLKRIMDEEARARAERREAARKTKLVSKSSVAAVVQNLAKSALALSDGSERNGEEEDMEG